KEAVTAKNAAVRELYKSLAEPFDLINAALLKGGYSDFRILPVSVFLDPPTVFPEKLQIDIILNTKKQGTKQVEVPRSHVRRVVLFEQFALKQVNDFLAKEKIPPLEQLQAAEKALAAVIRFHETTRERGLAGANPWAEIEKQLNDRFLDVRRRQALALIDEAV